MPVNLTDVLEGEDKQTVKDIILEEGYDTVALVNVKIATREPIITKNTAFNKDFGLGHDNIMRGDALIVENISEMMALDILESTTVNVKGYYSANDGGGGIFNYDASQSAVNNGGTIIDGWVRQYSGAINVKWFGAKGDTVLTGRNVFISGTDNTDIINNIISSLGSPLKAISIFIPKGIYLISGSITNKSSTTGALNLVGFIGEDGSGIDFVTSAASKKYPSAFYKNNAGNMFSWNINSDGSAVEAHGRPITLKNLSLASDEASTGVYAVNGYWMGSSLIQNINIAFFDYSIKMDGSTDHLTDDYTDGVTMHNINIVGVKKEGIRIRGADYSSLDRIFIGEFARSGYLGIGLVSSFGSMFSNILINDMDYDESSSVPGMFGSAACFSTSFCKAIAVSGAHFERNLQIIFNIRNSHTIKVSTIYSFRTYSVFFRLLNSTHCEASYCDFKERASPAFTGSDYSVYGNITQSHNNLFFNNRAVDTSDVEQSQVLYLDSTGFGVIKDVRDVKPELCKISYDGTGDGSAGSGVTITDLGIGGLSITAADVTVASTGEIQIVGAYNGKPYGVSLFNSGANPVSYIPKLNNTGFLSIYMIAISDGSTLSNKTTAFSFALSFSLLK